jgi:hypothetical protein
MTTGEQIRQAGAFPITIKRLETLSYSFSTANLILALNFAIAVPLLGWLSFGHGGDVLLGWLPDAILLAVLPAGYALYWHLWFFFGIPAVFGSAYLYIRTGRRGAQYLVVANAVAIAAYWVARIAMGLYGIHPDIV